MPLSLTMKQNDKGCQYGLPGGPGGRRDNCPADTKGSHPVPSCSAGRGCCLCLAVLGGGAYGAYGMPYGTVEVRINPDVKMSVSYMDRVVGLEGVNEDGKNSLTRCHIREETQNI